MVSLLRLQLWWVYYGGSVTWRCPYFIIRNCLSGWRSRDPEDGPAGLLFALLRICASASIHTRVGGGRAVSVNLLVLLFLSGFCIIVVSVLFFLRFNVSFQSKVFVEGQDQWTHFIANDLQPLEHYADQLVIVEGWHSSSKQTYDYDMLHCDLNLLQWFEFAVGFRLWVLTHVTCTGHTHIWY